MRNLRTVLIMDRYFLTGQISISDNRSRCESESWILNQNACVTCLHCETQSEGSSTCFWIHCPLLSLSFSPPSLQVTHVNITAVTATRLHGRSHRSLSHNHKGNATPGSIHHSKHALSFLCAPMVCCHTLHLKQMK